MFLELDVTAGMHPGLNPEAQEGDLQSLYYASALLGGTSNAFFTLIQIAYHLYSSSGEKYSTTSYSNTAVLVLSVWGPRRCDRANRHSRTPVWDIIVLFS